MLINNSLLDISFEILSFDQLENENWVQLYGVICNLQPVRKIIYMCVVNVGQMFSRIHTEEGIYFLMGIILSCLGARDLSSAVSGFCQVCIVTRGFGRSANTENSHRTREKPLVPRV